MMDASRTRPQNRRSPTRAASHPEPTSGAGGIAVPVPVVAVRQMHLSRPHVPQVPQAVRDRLPERNQLIYYGGLGALAAFGIVSWPIAAAIGAGVWVAGHARSSSARSEESSAKSPPGTVKSAPETVKSPKAGS
jgi:hypothetical protein